MSEISVIIPTRNRPALLGRCLASLCEQTLDPDRFDICVVNNGSAELAAKVIALINAHYPKHQIIRIDETRTGVAYARNAGVVQMSAPLIAQGDDDIVAPPDWLERFLAAFKAQGDDVGKIGGGIVPVWEAERPIWLTDAMLPMLAATGGLGDKARFVDDGLPMGNSCYRRKPLEQAGGFPVTLGRKGNNLLTGEQAVDRVIAARGSKLYYDPSLAVQHVIPAGQG